MKAAFLLEYKIHSHNFSLETKLNLVRHILFFIMFGFTTICSAQVTEAETQFFRRMNATGGLPEKLLSARTVVFYSYTFSIKELESIQQSFQRTGIDAVGYFESDYLFAGQDVFVALADYLNKREITNLIFIQKRESAYALYATTYNTKATLTEENQYAWHAQDKSLSELLLKVYRTAANSLKKQNLLISEFPETGLTVNPIQGRRNDFFAIDLKVDPIAIPKFGDETLDRELEEIFKSYPYKYKLTEPGLTEKELRKQGYYYILSFVHARAKVAKTVLGYDMTKAESAFVSVTYPSSQPVLKNYSADTPVYKFYIKHIDSQNVFLGTKWDADITPRQALLNHLQGFKVEFRIN